MTSTSAGREKRRHKRYLVKENAMSLDHFIIAQIINLSMGGLKFCCLMDICNTRGYLVKLDIYFAGKSLRLRGIPCEIVFNKAIEKVTSFGSLLMRECAVKFGQLTVRQIARLQYIITERTVGDV